VIGQQPWISVYSNTVRGIDIILSWNIQCIHSLIVVEKLYFYLTLKNIFFIPFKRGALIDIALGAKNL
jgi:hypothetical protein